MRYALIGYGNIGRKRHNILNEKCVAIVDPYQKEATYKNYKEMPLDIFDAALLAVPNSIKIEMLEYLLINKKHVIIEKPLIFSDKQTAYKLNSISKDNNVIWYTSYNHHFEPMVMKLKKILEENVIGQLYFAKTMYGNGTVQNIIGTWRDTGHGVLEDLGCHLLDLATYLFPEYSLEHKIIGAHNFEAIELDYCSFSTVDDHFHFLCSTLMWKNTFTIDVFGSKGSIHLDGLQKWEGSQLIHRKRVFPSGIPKETIYNSKGADETWKKDIEHFEKMISSGKSSFENDLNISQSIHSLTTSKKTKERF